MRIILQKDVKNLGQAGDTVSVKKGYARHFLIPGKWAIPFTKGSAKEVLHRKQWIEAKKKKALNARQSLVEKLKTVSLSFEKSADTSGHLFGSVTVFEISKQLQDQGYEVDKKVIKLDQPLKITGEHKVLLDFGSNIKTDIVLNIKPAILKNKKTKEDSLTKEEEKIKETKKATKEKTAEETTKEAKNKTPEETKATEKTRLDQEIKSTSTNQKSNQNSN